MRVFDHLALAVRNLWRRKLRSLLTITAVVIGAVSVIIMLSLVLGAKRTMVKQMESIGALKLVTVSGDPNAESSDNLFNTNVSNDPEVKKLDARALAAVRAISNVEGVTPVLPVWVRSLKHESSDKKTWANILGVDPAARVFDVPLAAGRPLRSGDMAQIVLGDRARRQLGGKPASDLIGSEVRLVVDGWNYYNEWTENPPMPGPDGKSDDLGTVSRTIPARIVGVAAPGMNDDSNFVTLAWARKLMTMRRWEFDGDKQRMQIVRDDMVARQGYASIMVRAKSTEHVAGVASAAARMGYGVVTAQEMLDGIGKIFLILGVIAGAIGGIALLVACIGIINTMLMSTYERVREIGVMRACGATRATVRRLFTIEAGLIGLIGGAVALGASYALAQIANVLINRFATQQNIKISDVMTFPLWLIAGVLGLTALVGLAAGVYPARRAARLDPVVALRFE